MKVSTISVFILLTSIVCSCLKKVGPVPTNTTAPNADTVVYTVSKKPVNTPITGSWQWVLTNASEGGLSTPASTHNTMRIEFKTDSTVKEIKNDTVGLHENYTYLKNYTFFDNSVSDAIEMGSVYYRATITHDTLRLDLVVMTDPSYSLFVKIK